MNWEIIQNPHSSLQEYRLVDNNDCKLILKYNPRQQSARLNSNNLQRLVFFESAGALSGKHFIKNEYGLEIGLLTSAGAMQEKGSLLLDNKKFSYQIKSNGNVVIEIVAKEGQETFSCIINNKSNIAQLAITDIYCCLLGICWYAQKSFQKTYLELVA